MKAQISVTANDKITLITERQIISVNATTKSESPGLSLLTHSR